MFQGNIHAVVATSFSQQTADFGTDFGYNALFLAGLSCRVALQRVSGKGREAW